MTPGVGPRAAARLLERFGSAERVFEASRDELTGLRLRAEAVDSIVARDQFERAQTELEQVRDAGADVLILDDGNYPQALREISDPPVVLYVKGELEKCLEQPTVAVVGSRACSPYGANTATNLARELARRGVTIVSGLARGIDAAAHKGAVEARGRTIGVLGTGVDNVYPREHRKLVDEMLATGGAVVSQFPLGTPPIPENFPYRNRIISGLSFGVMLVEAAENSGSLITARLALEQNREVFAVPGNITSRNSFGTNYLIKSAGAKLVQQWQDVVSEFPPEIAAQILPPELEKKRGRGKRAGLEPDAPADLTDAERAIFQKLSADEPQHIDDLASDCKLSAADAAAALLGLEMRDLVRKLPGNSYMKKL